MKQIWLSTKELAERLGLDVKSVRRLGVEGPKVPKDKIPMKRIGRLCKFNIRDVEEWEAGRRGQRRRIRSVEGVGR